MQGSPNGVDLSIIVVGGGVCQWRRWTMHHRFQVKEGKIVMVLVLVGCWKVVVQLVVHLVKERVVVSLSSCASTQRTSDISGGCIDIINLLGCHGQW